MSNLLCCWEAICNLNLALPLQLFSFLSLRPDFVSCFLKSLFFPSFHMLQRIFRTRRVRGALSFSRRKDRATGHLFHSVPQVAHPQTPESCAYNDPSINLLIQDLLSRVHATKKKLPYLKFVPGWPDRKARSENKHEKTGKSTEQVFLAPDVIMCLESILGGSAWLSVRVYLLQNLKSLHCPC